MDLKKILIVDNDPSIIAELVGFLYGEPYEVFTAKNKIGCLDILKGERIDLTIVEMYMEDMDGLNLLKWMKTKKFYTAMLIMTSQRTGTMELGEAVIKSGAASVFDKPIKKDVFLAKIQKYMPQQNMWMIWLESFLENNYSNPHIRFEDVMNYFRFSRSYGCFLFKKYMGKTFREVLREIRVRRARFLLEETSLPICEIAKKCGFLSSQRLSEAFSRIYNISPLNYRKSRHMRKQLEI